MSDTSRPDTESSWVVSASFYSNTPPLTTAFSCRLWPFISGIKANPKTVRNIYVTLQMMWKSACAWQYVAHDALDGVVLPKRRKPRRFFFTQEEVSRILGTAEEPYRTFYLSLIHI